jgi:hypothetical protein
MVGIRDWPLQLQAPPHPPQNRGNPLQIFLLPGSKQSLVAEILYGKSFWVIGTRRIYETGLFSSKLPNTPHGIGESLAKLFLRLENMVSY